MVACSFSDLKYANNSDAWTDYPFLTSNFCCALSSWACPNLMVAAMQVPSQYITGLSMIPDIDHNRLAITVNTNPTAANLTAQVQVLSNGTQVGVCLSCSAESISSHTVCVRYLFMHC